MGQLARFVRFCFGLQAMVLVGAVPITLLLTVALRKGGTYHTYASDHVYTSEDFPGGPVLLGLIAIAFEILPAIAWWKLKKGDSSARRWALAASVASFPTPIPALEILKLPIGAGGVTRLL